MSGPFTIEPLSSAIDRSTFTCGILALDRYFREQVTQDVKRRLSNCFVALDQDKALAAYYTLAATSLPLNELAAEETKKLPRYPLLPAGLIGRLAVDHRYQGSGLGGALVVDAVNRAMRSEPAIYALVVDAKDEKASRFYQHLGFIAFLSQPLRLFLPLARAAQRLAGQPPS